MKLGILSPTAKRFTPPAGDEQLQRARLSVTLASITATAPLLVFNLALVERKWKVLLNRGPFLLEQPLQWWEKILFVCFFAAAILLLVVTASAALWWVIRRLMGLQAWWMAKLTVLPVALAYFAAVTAQYEVVQYFRDGLNLALIRGLGGGNWMTALRYVQDEFAGLLPAIAAALVVMVVGGWLVRKYSGHLATWLARRWPVQMLASPRGLLTANAMMIVCPLAAIDGLVSLARESWVRNRVSPLFLTGHSSDRPDFRFRCVPASLCPRYPRQRSG